jgi:Holliday junction resolvase RusA-like endonuclease
MPEIYFFVPGTVEAKQSVLRGRNSFYTKPKSRNYENLVKSIAFEQMKGLKPAQGAVEVNMIIYYGIPTSWSNKKKSLAIQNRLKPLVKPDRDNCIKVVQDAMNQIVYLDDKQVTDGYCLKRYSDQVGIEVQVKWDE